MDISRLIHWALQEGYTVQSNVTGKVGRVKEVEGSLMYTVHNNQPGVISFMLGEPIKLDINPMKREVLIQNTGTSK